MVLPDVIRPGLRVVFCGTAVGIRSARRGAYYAGPGNKFWPTLYAVGLTSRRLEPGEYASAVKYGIGLTDLCKLRSGSDTEIGSSGFDVHRVEEVVRDNAPWMVAFNGVNAGRTALGSFERYGVQSDTFGGVEAWVLPSTSGAANRWWDLGYWHDLSGRVQAMLSAENRP
jgi:TDG/mug DNA glycosylase family protein